MGLYRVTIQHTIYVSAANDEMAGDVAVEAVDALDDAGDVRTHRIYQVDRIDRSWVRRPPVVGVTEDDEVEYAAGTCEEIIAGSAGG